jgi:O-antigen/teichoic acid export membrane protein
LNQPCGQRPRRGLRFSAALVPFLRDRFDGHLREVAVGAGVAFALKVLSAGLTFAFTVVLARSLGASNTGVFFLALTVTTIGATIGKGGLDVALLRVVSGSAAVGDWAAVKGAYAAGMRAAFLCSSAAAAGVFVAAPWFAGSLFSEPQLTTLLRWMCLSLVPTTLYLVHAELLKGLRRIAEAVAVMGVIAPLTAVASALLLLPRWGIRGAVAASVTASLLTLACGVLLWRRATPQLRGSPAHFASSELWRSARPLWGVALGQLVFQWSSTLMLGIWATKADVGVFGAAARTAMLTSFVLMAFNSILAPKLAALHRQGNAAALSRTVQGATWLLTLLAAPVLLVFLAVPAAIMAVFGPQFAPAGAPLLAIMAAGQFVNVATGGVGVLLVMTGNERAMRNATVFSAVAHVALNAALILRWGALGAALATAISVALQNLLLVAVAWRRLGIMTIPGLCR